jgi:hypothetical protein
MQLLSAAQRQLFSRNLSEIITRGSLFTANPLLRSYLSGNLPSLQRVIKLINLPRKSCQHDFTRAALVVEILSLFPNPKDRIAIMQDAGENSAIRAAINLGYPETFHSLYQLGSGLQQFAPGVHLPQHSLPEMRELISQSELAKLKGASLNATWAQIFGNELALHPKIRP